MLNITVPGGEIYNSITKEFKTYKDVSLVLEHSLVSLSKWESKWHKPFLSTDKTEEETIDYIRCMTVNHIDDESVYNRLSRNNILDVKDYIDNPMTATWFNDNDKSGSSKGEVITNELIYYWMISNAIPVEFEKWHLNRLLTLLRICSIKNSGENKKMSKADVLRQNADLNAARRAKLRK